MRNKFEYNLRSQEDPVEQYGYELILDSEQKNDKNKMYIEVQGDFLVYNVNSNKGKIHLKSIKNIKVPVTQEILDKVALDILKIVSRRGHINPPLPLNLTQEQACNLYFMMQTFPDSILICSFDTKNKIAFFLPAIIPRAKIWAKLQENCVNHPEHRLKKNLNKHHLTYMQIKEESSAGGGDNKDKEFQEQFYENFCFYGKNGKEIITDPLKFYHNFDYFAARSLRITSHNQAGEEYLLFPGIRGITPHSYVLEYFNIINTVKEDASVNIKNLENFLGCTILVQDGSDFRLLNTRSRTLNIFYNAKHHPALITPTFISAAEMDVEDQKLITQEIHNVFKTSYYQTKKEAFKNLLEELQLTQNTLTHILQFNLDWNADASLEAQVEQLGCSELTAEKLSWILDNLEYIKKLSLENELIAIGIDIKVIFLITQNLEAIKLIKYGKFSVKLLCKLGEKSVEALEKLLANSFNIIELMNGTQFSAELICNLAQNAPQVLDLLSNKYRKNFLSEDKFPAELLCKVGKESLLVLEKLLNNFGEVNQFLNQTKLSPTELCNLGIDAPEILDICFRNRSEIVKLIHKTQLSLGLFVKLAISPDVLKILLWHIEDVIKLVEKHHVSILYLIGELQKNPNLSLIKFKNLKIPHSSLPLLSAIPHLYFTHNLSTKYQDILPPMRAVIDAKKYQSKYNSLQLNCMKIIEHNINAMLTMKVSKEVAIINTDAVSNMIKYSQEALTSLAQYMKNDISYEAFNEKNVKYHEQIKQCIIQGSAQVEIWHKVIFHVTNTVFALSCVLVLPAIARSMYNSYKEKTYGKHATLFFFHPEVRGEKQVMQINQALEEAASFTPMNREAVLHR